MKNILVLGAKGQIGTELSKSLAKTYGQDHVITSDILNCDEVGYERIDVCDAKRIYEVVKKYNIDTIYNLAAILSAAGEKTPQLLWKVNMEGIYNTLEIARENNLKVFTPSSIAAFGGGTPKTSTPQITVQRPSTIYGVSKVAGELLCDYYHLKYGVDTRGVRLPGLISYEHLPGGGTTDYAVHIYFEAVKNKHYTCVIKQGTFMDMMYMPDAVKAMIEIMQADPSRLRVRNAYNISSMSFDPEMIKNSIQKILPQFTMDYHVDEKLQAIADSWPDSLDVSYAVQDWGFSPEFDLDAMSKDMIEHISEMTFW